MKNHFRNFLILGNIVLISSCGAKFSKSQYYATDYKTGSIQQKNGIGFEFPEKYTIDVFFENGSTSPTNPYEILKIVEVSGERPINENDTQGGRMLIEGNSQAMKKELLQQLIDKTLELGGTALVDVKYSVYTSANATGYLLSGKAVRYKINSVGD